MEPISGIVLRFEKHFFSYCFSIRYSFCQKFKNPDSFDLLGFANGAMGKFHSAYFASPYFHNISCRFKNRIISSDLSLSFFPCRGSVQRSISPFRFWSCDWVWFIPVNYTAYKKTRGGMIRIISCCFIVLSKCQYCVLPLLAQLELLNYKSHSHKLYSQVLHRGTKQRCLGKIRCCISWWCLKENCYVC